MNTATSPVVNADNLATAELTEFSYGHRTHTQNFFYIPNFPSFGLSGNTDNLVGAFYHELTHAETRFNLGYALAEALWNLGGTNNICDIQPYSDKWTKQATDNLVYGNVGHQLRTYNDLDKAKSHLAEVMHNNENGRSNNLGTIKLLLTDQAACLSPHPPRVTQIVARPTYCSATNTHTLSVAVYIAHTTDKQLSYDAFTLSILTQWYVRHSVRHPPCLPHHRHDPPTRNVACVRFRPGHRHPGRISDYHPPAARLASCGRSQRVNRRRTSG